MILPVMSYLISDFLRDRCESALKWETVHEWIAIYGNRGNIDRSDFECRPPSDHVAGYAELVRGSYGGIVYIHAKLFFDSCSGPIAAAVWEAPQLDPKLEKLFENNREIRLSV